MSGTGLDIQKRAILKSHDKYTTAEGKEKKYPRYTVSLPREFVEKHDLDELFLVADQVWFGLPTEEALMKVIVMLPQIKELISEKGLSQKDIQKLLELNPEIREFILAEGEEKNAPNSIQ